MRAPALPAAEQLALVTAWQRAHDRAARDRLVLTSAGLAWALAARYQHAGVEWDDLVAEAQLALVAACDSYPADGRDWTAWAYGCVRVALTACVQRAQHQQHDALDEQAEEQLVVDSTQETEIAAHVVAVQVRRHAARLADLSPYYDALLRQRWLAAEPASLATLGVQLGMARTRLRQIEAGLLERLAGELAPLTEVGP